MTHDCTALLAMPVTNRPEAEAFITALHGAGLMHHFDDGAVDCLHGNGLVTLADAEQIEAQVALCYTAWEKSGADMRDDCPIGHALKVMDETPIETHRHVVIYHASGEGYHASAGCAVNFGYCDTLEEIRAEIDDHWAEQAGEPPLDTPSLDTSFHDHEVNV